MSFNAEQVAKDRQLLLDAQQQGGAANLKAFAKLSGPGWLQSALTLGGRIAGKQFIPRSPWRHDAVVAATFRHGPRSDHDERDQLRGAVNGRASLSVDQ